MFRFDMEYLVYQCVEMKMVCSSFISPLLYLTCRSINQTMLFYNIKPCKFQCFSQPPRQSLAFFKKSQDGQRNPTKQAVQDLFCRRTADGQLRKIVLKSVVFAVQISKLHDNGTACFTATVSPTLNASL